MYFQLALRPRPREGARAAASGVEGQGAVRLAAQGRREGCARRRRAGDARDRHGHARGMTTEEFEKIVKDWLATARHPKFKRPYTELRLSADARTARLPARERLQDLHRLRRRHRVHAAVDGEGLRRPARAGRRQQHQDEVRDARRQAGARAAAGDRLHRRQGRQAGRHQLAHRPPARSPRSATPTATSRCWSGRRAAAARG